MKKESGETRCVFIFKNIVIKIAMIYWWNIIDKIMDSLLCDLKLLKRGLRYYLDKKREEKKSCIKSLSEYEEDRIINEKKMQMKILPTKSYEIHHTFGNFLLSGIMANLQEWQFYKQNKNPFCMPTYFSFLGLFNIQKKGEKIDFWDIHEIWRYVVNNSQNPKQPLCDGHALSEPKNYCTDNGKLKLVDYGNRQVAEFLKLNGKKLYNNFKHP